MLSPILEPVLFQMIHALHGNFGLPSDWDAALPPEIPAKAWHLWEIRRHHSETHTLSGFATWFNNQIEALPPDPHRILAGYSLGGRLALHVLADRPALWHRALIISAHPGLRTGVERATRLAHDLQWRKLCLDEPWDAVCARWNAQPLFKAAEAVSMMQPSEAWRAEIASAFEGWSLSHQAGLPGWPPHQQTQGYWLAGALDTKFSALAKKACSLWIGFEPRILEDASHRLLSEKPGALREFIEVLLGKKQKKDRTLPSGPPIIL